MARSPSYVSVGEASRVHTGKSPTRAEIIASLTQQSGPQYGRRTRRILTENEQAYLAELQALEASGAPDTTQIFIPAGVDRTAFIADWLARNAPSTQRRLALC